MLRKYERERNSRPQIVPERELNCAVKAKDGGMGEMSLMGI